MPKVAVKTQGQNAAITPPTDQAPSPTFQHILLSSSDYANALKGNEGDSDQGPVDIEERIYAAIPLNPAYSHIANRKCADGKSCTIDASTGKEEPT